MLIRICQVVASAGRGGLEKHVQNLSAGLANDCHVSVIAPAECASDMDSRIDFHAFDFSASRHSPFALYRLWRLIRRIDPDIVHCQANKAAAMVTRFARFLDACIVGTIHNQKRAVSMFDRCDGVVAVSRDLAARIGHDRVRVIYNGIDPSRFRGGATQRAGNAIPIVLAIGRLTPAKAFDLLIEAWKDVDAELHIVGEGAERALLEGLITRHGLDGRVRLLGHRDDVPDLLQDADLVVVSSRREGFSYVVCEALMARRCVVSTDVPVANELLPERFIARIEAEDLARKVTAALKNLDGTSAAFAPLFAYARNELTVQGMTAATLAYYHELLASSPSAGH